MRDKLIKYICVIFILTFACVQKKDFAGTAPVINPSPSLPQSINYSIPTNAIPSAQVVDNCSQNSEYVSINADVNAYPEVARCLNQGLLFDYPSKTCSNASKLPEGCSYDIIRARVMALNIVNPNLTSLDQARMQGAKLVACGQKDNGRIIIAQWITSSAATVASNCSYKPDLGVYFYCWIDKNSTVWPYFTKPEDAMKCLTI